MMLGLLIPSTLHADLLILPKECPYRYLLLVFDEHTRYAFSKPLATKDKAAEATIAVHNETSSGLTQ
jgi:hypothetical protein